jgi:hypothetical protein
MSYNAEIYKASQEAAAMLRKALSLRAFQGYALVPGVFVHEEGPISDDVEQFTDILWWHNEGEDDLRPYIPLGAALVSHEKATDVLEVYVWDDEKQAMASPMPIGYLPPHIIGAFVDVMLATMEEADNMDTFRHNVGEELLAIYRRIGMDAPASHSDIVEFCAKEVRETADPREWNSDDVAIAFRRWMEWAGQVIKHVDDTIIDPPAQTGKALFLLTHTHRFGESKAFLWLPETFAGVTWSADFGNTTDETLAKILDAMRKDDFEPERDEYITVEPVDGIVTVDL